MGPLKDEVLVHLVGDGNEVVLDAQPGDGLELGEAEHPAARVVGSVQQEEAGGRRYRPLELFRIEAPSRRAQLHDAAPGTGQLDRGGVGVVVGLEDDDLVPLLAEAKHGRRDGLRGAGRDEDLRVGVEVEPPPARLVLGDRLQEGGHASPGRVLVLPAADGFGRRLEHLGRPVAVGETLPEVDRTRRIGQGRHLAEDGQSVGVEAPAAPEERAVASPRSRRGHEVVLARHEQAR